MYEPYDRSLPKPEKGYDKSTKYDDRGQPLPAGPEGDQVEATTAEAATETAAPAVEAPPAPAPAVEAPVATAPESPAATPATPLRAATWDELRMPVNLDDILGSKD